MTLPHQQNKIEMGDDTMIKKLKRVIEYNTYIQEKGIYYDKNGIPNKQKEDLEVITSYSRLPNNEEITEKINEIISFINKVGVNRVY